MIDILKIYIENKVNNTEYSLYINNIYFYCKVYIAFQYNILQIAISVLPE